MGRLCYLTTAPGRVLIPHPEYSGGPENCHTVGPDRAASERHGVQACLTAAGRQEKQKV
jgi:hypothetical protein